MRQETQAWQQEVFREMQAKLDRREGFEKNRTSNPKTLCKPLNARNPLNSKL